MNSTQCNYFWKYIYHVDQNRVNVTHLNFFTIKCKNKIKNWNCDWAIYVSVSGPDFMPIVTTCLDTLTPRKEIPCPIMPLALGGITTLSA